MEEVGSTDGRAVDSHGRGGFQDEGGKVERYRELEGGWVAGWSKLLERCFSMLPAKLEIGETRTVSGEVVFQRQLADGELMWTIDS